MKRDILEYAKLPDVPMSQLSPAEWIIARIAWMADNEGYGIKNAARRLIDDVRREFISNDTAVKPRIIPKVVSGHNLVGLMGMYEMECGVAHIINICLSRGGVKLVDVCLREKDFPDRGDFDQLVLHGWLEQEVSKDQKDRWWIPSDQLVARVRTRLIGSNNQVVRSCVS